MSKPVRLSACDWVEIDAALYSKIQEIENGDLGYEEDDQEWVEHLKSIRDAIGEDGSTASAYGVLPVRGYENPVCTHQPKPKGETK